jgi:hypothetical protein
MVLGLMLFWDTASGYLVISMYHGSWILKIDVTSDYISPWYLGDKCASYQEVHRIACAK